MLLLRLMVEVDDAAQAEAETRRATSSIAATVERESIEQYWKIPAYWEITLQLRPIASSLDLYERLVATVAEGWTLGEPDGDGRWAVWNWSPGAEFLTPRTRWAERL